MTTNTHKWNLDNTFCLAVGFSLALLSFAAVAQEPIESNSIQIVRNVYAAMNNSELDELETYFAEDIEVSSIQELTAPTKGKESVVEMLRQMLDIAKGSEFVLSAGPFAMGDIVSVEYVHHYEVDGDSRQDHNVSIFVFENQKISRWLGYIHQNQN